MKISVAIGQRMLQGIKDYMVKVEDGEPFQLVIYDGVEAEFSVPKSEPIPLVIFDLPDTVFGAINEGENILNMIAFSIPMAIALRPGEATWFRIYSGEDENLMQGSLSDGVILNTTAITDGAEITVESMTLTLPVSNDLPD